MSVVKGNCSTDDLIVKPKSKSPIPCPNRPQILTLRSDQVEKTQKPNFWTGADTIITWATTTTTHQ